MKYKKPEQPWYEKAAGKRKPRAEKGGDKRREQGKAGASTGKTATGREDSFHARKGPVGAGNSPRGQERGFSQKNSASAGRKGPLYAAGFRSLFSADRLAADARDCIEHFDQIAAGVRSLSGKQQVQLFSDIKQLSHTLTDERESRRLGYMNSAENISAYIGYFMWWNLVRLTRLFSNLPEKAFALKDGDGILDVGSGTLTLPVALWLSRPELRKKRLTVWCMDTSQNALAAGEELFLSVAARTSAADTGKDGAEAAEAGAGPWRIVRIRGALDDKVEIREKVALVTCANVFNEIIQSSDMPPDYLAKKYARLLTGYLDPERADASLFLVEPGDPKSARFLSLMRDALLRKDFAPLAPCPHCEACPMDGLHTAADGSKSGKWCNFAFATDDAPAGLLKRSERAGLPKDRATLSFLLSSRAGAPASPAEERASTLTARITSDTIRLPDLHKTGYYACSSRGLLLLLDSRHQNPASGDLVTVRNPAGDADRDKKSGALITWLV